MVAKKNQLEAAKEEKSGKSYKAAGSFFCAVLIIGGIGYYFWQNPEQFKLLKDRFFPSQQTEDIYQPQIDGLTQEIDALKRVLNNISYKAEHPDFSEMNKRIDDIEAIHVNTIKSKANVETVLGLIGRIDFAEAKLHDLAKVTDSSALTLTAAMLVKDAGERGRPFVYEAEVLAAVSEGNPKIQKEVQRLNEIASVGVPSVKDLQKKFVDVYLEKYPETKQEVKEEFSGDWKERIYYELNKVVQIKRTDKSPLESKEPEFSEEDRAWNVIKDFVAEGEIERAVSIIEKPLNEKVSHDEVLAKWLSQAKIYRDFYANISRISANSLAVMKVKFLKNN